jgi:O-antigen/teichoic acid export membrane protein
MSLRSILRNVFSNYALVIVTGLVSFWMTPLLVHQLTDVNYAVLVFALGISGVLGLMDVGLSGALVRFVSQLSSLGLEIQLRQLINTAFFLSLGIGTFLTVLLVISSPVLARTFHLQTRDAVSGQVIVAVVSLSVIFQLPAGIVRSVIEGQQDFQSANLVDIVVTVLRGAATLLVLNARLGLLPIAAILPATGMFRLVGMLLMAGKSPAKFRLSLSDVELKSLRTVWKFSALCFLEQTVTRLYTQMDQFIVARLLPLPQLATLVIARRFPSALGQVGVGAAWVGYPIVSSSAARGVDGAVERFLIVSTRNLLALMLPLATALFVWADVILKLWIGPEALSGVPIFRLFLMFSVLTALVEGPSVLLYGMGQITFSAFVSLAIFVAAVCIGTWACMHAGLFGLGVAFVTVQATGSVFRCWKALRVCGVSIIRYFSRGVTPAILAELAALLGFWIAYSVVPHNLIGLLMSVPPVFVVFGATFVICTVRHTPKSSHGLVRSILLEID